MNIYEKNTPIVYASTLSIITHYYSLILVFSLLSNASCKDL